MQHAVSFNETYFNTREQAMKKAASIRASNNNDLIVKVTKSPYGGFSLKLIPAEVAIDVAEQFPGIFLNR